MAAAYLFSSEGLNALARLVRADTLFVVNLDGILLPHLREPATLQMSEQLKLTLQRLMRLATVTVITARSRKDALTILGYEPHLLIGNQGAEWPDSQSGRNWQQVKNCLKWREQLYEKLCDFYDISIECTGETLSIHYQHIENPAETNDLITTAIAALAPQPCMVRGDRIVTLLPDGVLTKGEALRAATHRFAARQTIYFGSDESDEAIFQQGSSGLFAIRIGDAAPTAAPYYLRNKAELLGLLNSLVGTLESHG